MVLVASRLIAMIRTQIATGAQEHAIMRVLVPMPRAHRRMTVRCASQNTTVRAQEARDAFGTTHPIHVAK